MNMLTLDIPASGPKKKRVKKQAEGAVKNACIRALYLLGCFVWNNPTGAWRTPQGAWVPYGKKGSSDIIGLTPNGRMICVECKQGKNDTSLEQDEFRRLILEKKGIYILARDSAQAVFDSKELILIESW
jgi:hypothetical protein